MKNVEKAGRIHLKSLIKNLKDGNYVIPDFQRDFEWKPWDVQELIRSIFMDYYIGTLLLWKGNDKNYDSLSCEPVYGFEGKNPDPRMIVLDGQQRLTAMHYAFFGPSANFPSRKNKLVYRINIRHLLEEDYDNFIDYEFVTSKKLEKRLKDSDEQYKTHSFPLEILQDTWAIDDWIRGYRDYWRNLSENEEEEKVKAKYALYEQGAHQFRDLIDDHLDNFYISYIELDDEIDIAKVCDIFTQINSRGVRLDIFDLLNAMLRPKDIYLKQMWKDASNVLLFTDEKKMKIYVLQVMSVLEQIYCSPKYLYYMVPESVKTIRKPDGTQEKVVLIEDTEEFKERWEQSVKALQNAIRTLQNPRDYGAIKAAFVPYPSIIPAFASIKEYVRMEKPSNMIDVNEKIRKWYWASIFVNRYSSSVETSTAKDYQSLQRWFKNDDAEPDMIDEFRRSLEVLDLVGSNPKGSAIYNAIFNLLVINEARDWSTFDLPEYSELDDHHIVPISVFKEKAGKSINSILNRTPLSDSTNRHIIRNRMPNDYIAEMLENNNEDKVYDVLESHLISRKAVSILLRKPFEAEDFNEFIDERKKTILQAIKTQLLENHIELPEHLKLIDAKIEKVELAFRDLLVTSFGDNKEEYSAHIPPHIVDKVNRRVASEVKKHPRKQEEDFSSFSTWITFFDLSEYVDTVISKQNWEAFQHRFNSKEELQLRMRHLGNLRNSIRHSRAVSDIAKMDGEAAILWLKTALRNGD